MSVDHEILTPEEAADFLRLSRSTIYQRPDIPRHRLPGSRQIRSLRSELLTWVKGEPTGQSVSRITGGTSEPLLEQWINEEANQARVSKEQKAQQGHKQANQQKEKAS